jgi:hypothetical protein
LLRFKNFREENARSLIPAIGERPVRVSTHRTSTPRSLSQMDGHGVVAIERRHG